MKILTTLFGDITRGRLARLPYFGYTVLISVTGTVIALLVGASLGLFEQTAGGDTAGLQQNMAEDFGTLGIILLVIFGLVMMFANLNVSAKRLRDIGLPGWIGMLVIIIISAVLSALSENIASVFNLIVLLCLLLIPTGTVGGRSSNLLDK